MKPFDMLMIKEEEEETPKYPLKILPISPIPLSTHSRIQYQKIHISKPLLDVVCQHLPLLFLRYIDLVDVHFLRATVRKILLRVVEQLDIPVHNTHSHAPLPTYVCNRQAYTRSAAGD
jgi:hypothetical protein